MRSKEPDPERAATMFEKAWESGDPRAAYALATWYLHGFFYKKSFGKAVKLLRKASRSRIADAAYDLAICYELGAGVKKNLKRAAALYLDSALLFATQPSGQLHMYSFDEAAHEVGRCYYYGIGVTKDRRISKTWLSFSEKR